MRINRNVVGVLAVAGLAFAAGQMDLLGGAGSVASAEPRQDPGMTPEMEAWMKAGMPGDHHGHLNALAGEWEGVFKLWMEPGAPVMEMDGEISRAWVLDGHYLREKVTSKSTMGEFHGLGYLGFNNVDDRYEIAWMDSMSTAIMMAYGAYNPEKRIWEFDGTIRDPLSGKLLTTRSELDVSNPDRHVMVEYVSGSDGVEFKHFAGVMERKTKAATLR